MIWKILLLLGASIVLAFLFFAIGMAYLILRPYKDPEKILARRQEEQRAMQALGEALMAPYHYLEGCLAHPRQHIKFLIGTSVLFALLLAIGIASYWKWI